MALTKRQKEVLDFVADFIADRGYSPSYDEIAHALKLASLATVHKHLQALESRNYVRRGFNQSRSLEVSPKYMQERCRPRAETAMAEIPLAGRIAAGVPVETFASPTETLDLGSLNAENGTYALEVRGDSMIDDHICTGDFVIVGPAPQSIRDGEIVVALVNGAETTLKRFYAEPDGRVRLQPANSTMPPILVSRESLEIQGRVLAVLRKYS